MKLLEDMGSKNIKEAILAHPRIGEILDRFEIGCTKCTVGTCLLQDVVSVHFLGDATETQIEQEINDYLCSRAAETRREETGHPPASSREDSQAQP